MGQKIKPVFGEAAVVDGRIVARVRTTTGRTYVHNNEGRGFGSKLFALEVANKAMREGMLIRGYVRVS